MNENITIWNLTNSLNQCLESISTELESLNRFMDFILSTQVKDYYKFHFIQVMIANCEYSVNTQYIAQWLSYWLSGFIAPQSFQAQPCPTQKLCSNCNCSLNIFVTSACVFSYNAFQTQFCPKLYLEDYVKHLYCCPWGGWYTLTTLWYMHQSLPSTTTACTWCLLDMFTKYYLTQNKCIFSEPAIECIWFLRASGHCIQKWRLYSASWSPPAQFSLLPF